MLAYALACILIELTPGPNMAYLAILTLSAGRKAGIATVVGIALGLTCIAAAAAFGMAELIHQEPVLYQIIRWAGVLYLLWLAGVSWREREEVSPAKTDSYTQNVKYFRRGFTVNILNPKAAVFYLTVPPSFMNAAEPMAPQALTLIAISIGIATAVHLLIVWFANSLRHFIDSPHRQRFVRRLFAVLLAAVAVWFAVTT